MRRVIALPAVMLVAACASTPAATRPSASATLSPAASPTLSSTPSPSSTTTASPAQLQAQCTSSIPAQHPLAIATLGSDSTPLLLDVVDPLHPVTLCKLAGQVSALRFVSRTELAYASYGADGSGEIATLDLGSNQEVMIAGWPAGAFGAGTFAVSPDGQQFAYLASSSTGVELHLVANENDRTLATLPPVPGRGVSQDDDEIMLGFSPDGSDLALVETFTGTGTGDAAPFQVRRADGSLLAAGPTGRTMAVWSGSALFFRDSAGVERWSSPTATSTVLPGITWIRPSASPDGRFIGYTVRDATGLPHAYVYDAGLRTTRELSQAGAAEPVFLTASSVWFAGERLCGNADNCGMAGPAMATGQWYVSDLQTSRVSPSMISAVIDAWPSGR